MREIRFLRRCSYRVIHVRATWPIGPSEILLHNVPIPDRRPMLDLDEKKRTNNKLTAKTVNVGREVFFAFSAIGVRVRCQDRKLDTFCLAFWCHCSFRIHTISVVIYLVDLAFFPGSVCLELRARQTINTCRRRDSSCRKEQSRHVMSRKYAELISKVVYLQRSHLTRFGKE